MIPDELTEPLNTAKRMRALYADRIKFNTDKWVECQKKIIYLQETISLLEKIDGVREFCRRR